MILGTAGHIDHGKTALVKALTGVDTDRLPEEKRRGITIDLGFAPLTIDGAGTIGVVDVPGHEAFVRTMLAGASGIDLALLVVAADEGVMPQTREHLEILSLLQIPSGVVALTKCDLVDAEWVTLVREDVERLVRGTPLDGAPIIQVSARTGEGIDQLRQAIAVAAADAELLHRGADLFRMPIDRAFTVRGTGTVVTGTIWSGALDRDATVRILPGGKVVRVRGLESHGARVNSVHAGQRAAVALAGCDVDQVGRGVVLVADSAWETTREIEAALIFTDSKFSPTPRTRLRLHLGTSDTGARLSRIRRLKRNDGSVATVARIVLDEPVVARGRDRFVLRVPSPARTVGGGVVIDPFPPRPSRHRKDAASPPVEVGSDARGHVGRALDTAESSGVPVSSLPVRTGFTPSEVATALGAIESIVTGGRAYVAGTIERLANRIETTIAVAMANHPLEAGVSLQTVRATLNAEPEVVQLALDRLSKSNRIEISESVARPFGWMGRLTAGQQAVNDAIMHEICAKPVEPPSVSELSARLGSSAPVMLRRLEREGKVERVSEDRYYSRDAVTRMVEGLRSTLAPGRVYSPAELREVLGVSRKYLIPFLEFCDRKGVTERRDGGRVIRETSRAGSGGR